MPNSKQEILEFRRGLKRLANKLSGRPNRKVLIPAGRSPLRHTCEKAPAADQKPGPCAECAYEQRVKERLTALLGEPVK